ncbi:GAF and ANTAR domain-containing protein [Saccharopolyspora phatthalungensis]|uniref:GAF and ANTAR domain-containing protein n=1 Tax=Saccharopolyspora phatthalungensis TaxID=664693 RepID=UPI000B06757F|nr:GAF and ANTAR domain-containing protein [Saccharopolyspora phatthalungensis]
MWCAEIARDLASQRAEQDVLDRVVELALQFLEGCDDGGVMLLDRKHGLHTAALTSERVRESDEAQVELREGPCFDAALGKVPWEEQVYRSEDLASETRWPAYAPRARELGFASMLGFQLFYTEEHFGALNLYSNTRNTFDLRSQRKGWVLASHAAVALNSARTEDQLRTAMETRQEIGQAMGRLMERYQLSSEMAFAALKRASQNTNVKLAEVARTVVRTGVLPGAEK